MAADYRFMWVDAFTTAPMSGNACAVVFGADDIPADTRIRLVRETSLSECAYLQRSEKADFGARYYTAADEIKFAGHPTIATCRALEVAGLLEGRERFTLEVGAGVLPIEIARGAATTAFTMTTPVPSFGREYPAHEIAALFGLAADDIVGTPQSVSTGTAYCITVLKDLATLDRAKLDTDAIATYSPGTDFFEPFLCVTEGFTAEGDTAARLLLPPPLPAEDPFTGSATACMACYLWAKGLIDTPRFVAEQGHGMGRPGRATVEVLGPREAINGVRLSGTGAVLMQGTVRL